MPETLPDWTAGNQQHLVVQIDRVRRLLAAHIHSSDERADLPAPTGPAHGELDPPPMLVQIASVFGLSAFERDVLVLCAGIEMDSAVRELCAEALDGGMRSHVTFGLALAALPDPHWTALSPNGPLRYWRLVDLQGSSPTASPLAIDERVLHQLAGVPYLDPRLADRVHPVSPRWELSSRAQDDLVDRLVALLSSARGDLQRIQLFGDGDEARVAIAASATRRLGMPLHRISVADIPSAPEERGALVRLWERESLLGAGILIVDVPGDRVREPLPVLAPFLLETRVPVVLSAVEPVAAAPESCIRLRVPRPNWSELRVFWNEALGGASVGRGVASVVDDAAIQFRLDVGAMRAAAEHVRRDDTEPEDIAVSLWDACRVQARPAIDDLAQRIDPAAAWDDLVLPEAQTLTLRDIAVHFRQRATVHERWGWREKSSRGLGICALFAGPSGTGKTMAAEVLAEDLRLDLYRIDLSAVVSKYIGETEKNLQRIFDAAERGGVILLFDEADALFGKRSEVKDSHDRYANIEIGYLLQRMEAYRGLAILTTNMRSALDPAFLRRLRFVVEFPFPDAAARAEIWRRVFPARTPTADLDPDRLSRLAVAGGNIRNIALHASFLAAQQDSTVTMEHILRAARGEYSRLERPLSSGELRGLAVAAEVEP